MGHLQVALHDDIALLLMPGSSCVALQHRS